VVDARCLNSTHFWPHFDASDVFRSIFHSHGSSAYSAEQLNSLLFSVPSELLSAGSLKASGETTTLRELSGAVRELVSSKMAQENGKVSPVADPDSALKTRPITIVIIPEFLAEFVSSQPLRKVLERTESVFATRWKRALAQHQIVNDRYDTVYDLRALKNIQVPISETVQVASVDNVDGAPLLNIIYLKPRIGSLESLGSLRETTEYLMPRLSRVFNILGVPDEFYFMGFSRGAAVCLDMISQGRERLSEFPWCAKGKGVISIAGVNFGSLAADAVVSAGTPEHRVFSVLDSLGDMLHGVSSDDRIIQRSKKAIANLSYCNGAFLKMSRALLQWPIRKEFLLENHRPQSLPGMSAIYFFKKLTVDVFDFTAPVEEFFQNSQRFKVLSGKFFRAVSGLTTKSRLDWWRANTVPADVELFALGACFGDPTTENSGFSLHARNPLAYNWRALDTVFLRFGYYSMYNNTGIAANDGLVSLDRAFFWPSLMQALNPQQSALRVHNLGVLGVDHMGAVVDSATYSENTGGCSPFPQELLLRAIASYVSMNSANQQTARSAM
jgi:hypothetical protein